jgi:TPR repeat protein
MIKRLLFAMMIVLPLMLNNTMAVAQESPPSENVRTRPNKQEIIELMVKMRRMPASKQDGRMDELWKNPSASQAIRSDFMMCTGLAYLGNFKAQAYVGSGYENGRGVVEDLSEAYAWFAVALENAAADKAAEQRLQTDRDRVKDKLLSVYPAPTDEDLDDLVKAQKSRIAQYQEEANKVKN